MLAIGAILIAIWFFNSAKRANKNPYLWVIVGIISFYIFSIFCLYGILKPFLEHAFFIHHMKTGIAIKASALIFGVLMGALIHWKFLGKTDEVNSPEKN
jgi:hypothetical protein